MPLSAVPVMMGLDIVPSYLLTRSQEANENKILGIQRAIVIVPILKGPGIFHTNPGRTIAQEPCGFTTLLLQ